MKTGIDLKQLKKYITKMYGKQCKDYKEACIVCITWELYDDIGGFLENDEYLKDY